MNSITGMDMPSSFSGVPGQSSMQNKGSNLITYGLCFILAAAALFAVKFVKRR